MWEVVTGVDVKPCRGLLLHTLANRALEGSVLKAICHWGSNGNVTNNAPGNIGRTPLYVGLPSVWGSMGGNCFPCVSWESSLSGDSKGYECMNEQTSGSGNVASCFIGVL